MLILSPQLVVELFLCYEIVLLSKVLSEFLQYEKIVIIIMSVLEHWIKLMI